MKTEFTTSELIRLTGINPRTLTNWTRKGWLPPFRAGGGRGAQNVFDIHAAAWTMTLSEIFRIWPDASTPVHLAGWQGQDDGYVETWAKTQLSDGSQILNFMRTPFVFARGGTIAVLVQGHDHDTGDRFAELQIGPANRIKPFVDGWLNAAATLTQMPDNPDKIVSALTVFHHEQNRRKVESAAKRL